MPSMFRNGILGFSLLKLPFCVRNAFGFKEAAEGRMNHSGVFSNFKISKNASLSEVRGFGEDFFSVNSHSFSQPVGSYLIFQDFSPVIKTSQATYSQ